MAAVAAADGDEVGELVEDLSACGTADPLREQAALLVVERGETAADLPSIAANNDRGTWSVNDTWIGAETTSTLNNQAFFGSPADPSTLRLYLNGYAANNDRGNIRVAALCGRACEDRRHGILIPLPRRAGFVRSACS